jgi:hypothetical protein
VLAEIVRDAVEERLDLDVWQGVIEQETEFREELQQRLQ